jgi:hypothetical protein
MRCLEDAVDLATESTKWQCRALMFSRACCEPDHTRAPGLALLRETCGLSQAARIESMKTRRLAYWWFRFVVSGRFFEKFLKLRRR